MDLKGKKVLVTGGGGFLGQHTVKAFEDVGATVVAPRSYMYDLRKQDDVRSVIEAVNPAVIVHLAAAVGGIAANAENPGKYFYENILMGSMLMHEAYKYGVQKYVQVGTSCSYPAQAPTPVKETDLWSGAPNPVTGPYGIAKLALITMADAYRQQYGFNVISLIPVNLYGPNDHFGPNAHVIPMLIDKAIACKETGEPLVVWGTGKATREFLYVEECAQALVLATEHYDKPTPVNLGTGVEVPIADIARTVADVVGFAGEISWDTTKPDGQLRRCFDVSKAKEEFGFEAKMPLPEGIKRTVEWYLHG